MNFQQLKRKAESSGLELLEGLRHISETSRKYILIVPQKGGSRSRQIVSYNLESVGRLLRDPTIFLTEDQEGDVDYMNTSLQPKNIHVTEVLIPGRFCIIRRGRTREFLIGQTQTLRQARAILGLNSNYGGNLAHIRGTRF